MHLILQKGNKGKDVKKIQHWLNNHGYKAGEEDGNIWRKNS